MVWGNDTKTWSAIRVSLEYTRRGAHQDIDIEGFVPLTTRTYFCGFAVTSAPLPSAQGGPSLNVLQALGPLLCFWESGLFLLVPMLGGHSLILELRSMTSAFLYHIAMS